MNRPCLDRDRLLSQLKDLIAGMFRPDIHDPGAMADDWPLSDFNLGGDSLDRLELALCVEEQFGIAICDADELRDALTSFATLAGFICAHAPSANPRRGLLPWPHRTRLAYARIGYR